MPTSATVTFEPGSAKLDPVFPKGLVRTMNVTLAAGTYVRGQVLGELTATPGKYKAYASGNTDGSQVPKGLLQYSCVVDASGNVTLAGEFAQTQLGVPMIMGGGHIWDTTQLTGLDANAITVMGASLVEGTAAAGLLRF
jgi:Bacteriophage lambda head decoration protein D